MVNICKDWNLRQFKICKEGVPGSSTALKFLYRRYHTNLNKTWMIMVIIHTNSLAQKLLYLSFHFQNVVDCEAFLLSFTWGRGFQFLDAVLWNWDYGSIYFWTHPLSSHPDLVVLIPSSASPTLLVCSPDIELMSSLTFGSHLKFLIFVFPLSPSLLLFPPSFFSLSLLELNQ